MNADTLVAIGSFLIGAFYLLEYGLRLLRQIVYSLAVSAGDTIDTAGQFESLRQNTMNWQDFSSNLLIVIAALVMMFRPVYFVRIFRWLRSAGNYRAALAQQDEPKAERSSN